eukprot:1158441-Pelagomonas_calceolata.AAC.3
MWSICEACEQSNAMLPGEHFSIQNGSSWGAVTVGQSERSIGAHSHSGAVRAELWGSESGATRAERWSTVTVEQSERSSGAQSNATVTARHSPTMSSHADEGAETPIEKIKFAFCVRDPHRCVSAPTTT